MKKIVFKIFKYFLCVTAVAGFLFILGAAGASDAGAPAREWLPPLLAGVAMFLFGAAPLFLANSKI